MGLFSVVCETCQARLTVRERSLIGQIVECPKCGSMVGIFPPPGWQPPGEAAPAKPTSAARLSDGARPSATPQRANRGSASHAAPGTDGTHRAPAGDTPHADGSPQTSRPANPKAPSPARDERSHQRGDTAKSGGVNPPGPGKLASADPASPPVQRTAGPNPANRAAGAPGERVAPSGGQAPQTRSASPAAPAEGQSTNQPSGSKRKGSGAAAAKAVPLQANLAQVADVGLDLTSASAGKVASTRDGSAAKAPVDESADGRLDAGDSLDAWASHRGSGNAAMAHDDLAALPDWYAAQTARRWIWISASAAAGLVLIVGSWLLFRGGGQTESEVAAAAQPAAPAPVQPQPMPETPEASPPDNIPSDESPVPDPPPAGVPMAPAEGQPDEPQQPKNVLPEVFVAWQPQWLPPSTAAVLTVRPASLLSQPVFPAELASSTAEQWRLLGPVASAFDLEPHEISRITWATVKDHLPLGLDTLEGGSPLRRSVIAIELIAEAEHASQRLAASPPLDLKLRNVPCRMLENSPWPFPFAIVDGRTLVTGPSDLLQSFATSGGTVDGLRSQSIKTLLAKIGEADTFAVVVDNAATGWMAQVPPTWLPVGPGRVAWGRLAKAPAIGLALEKSFQLTGRLYALGGSGEEAKVLASDLAALLKALAQMEAPPAWWPKLPGPAPLAPQPGVPQVAGVGEILADLPSVRAPEDGPRTAFDLPGLTDPAAIDPAAPPGGPAMADQPAGVTGPQTWRMLIPLWESAQPSSDGALAEVRISLDDEPAIQASLALATLAHRTPDEDALADALEPDPALDPGLDPAEMPAEPEPQAPMVDVAARLKDRLVGIELRQVPLADALDVLSEISRIPLAYDIAEMQAMGVSPSDPVDLISAETTVGDAIQGLLAKKRLRFQPRERYIFITAQATEGDEPRTVDYPVDDLLVAGSTDTQSLSALIRQFIAPASWQSEGGSGTITAAGQSLSVVQSHAVQRQVARFLDQLRAARGKPPRTAVVLSKPPLQTPFAAASDNLGKTVTANFVKPTPLRRVLRYLQEQAGIRVILDAASLPDTVWAERPVTLSATDTTMATAIARLASDLGVGLRIIDGQTIEFLGQDRLAAELEIAFYSLAGLAGAAEPAAAWANRIPREVEPTQWNQESNTPAIAVDGPSQTLIVRQDQATQVAIERWLQQQRKSRP